MQENSKHLRLLFKKKQLGKSTKVINKNDIVFIFKNRRNRSRAPNITVYKLLRTRTRLNMLWKRKFVHLSTYTRLTLRANVIMNRNCNIIIERR